MPLSTEKLQQIVQFSESISSEPLEAAAQVEAQLGLSLPETLKRIHQLGGGAMIRNARCHKQPYNHPTENCDLYALVTNPFAPHYSSDILTAYRRMLSGLGESREAFRRVIPFGGDGAGGWYCLDHRVSDSPTVTKMYDGCYDLLARSFDEFVDRAILARRAHWESLDGQISEQEEKSLLGVLPDRW